MNDTNLPPLDPGLDPLGIMEDGLTKDELEEALLSGASLPVPTDRGITADEVQAAKQAWVTHAGNVAAVCRATGLTVKQVTGLASEHDWPLVGDGASKTDKSTKTRLENLHDKLERQMVELLDSLGVEKKARKDLNEKGLQSRYVASLSQRSSSFKQVFDAYCRVGEMIAPETFERGVVDANGVRSATGGLTGADRDLADFVSRVSVGIADEISRRDRGSEAYDDVVEAEVVG